MDILDETIEMYDRNEGRRPVFITVLCILSWVGSFLGLIFGVIQLYTYSAIQAFNKQLVQGFQMDTQNYGYMFWIAIGSIIGCILCSLGAFFMFRQKKIGFFIYLAGQIIPLIGVIYSTIIVSSGSPFQSLGIIGASIGMIFPVAFIIMYGVNLKYMNK